MGNRSDKTSREKLFNPPLIRGASEGRGDNNWKGEIKPGLITNGASLPYNPNLIEHARELRRNMTPAEKKIWHGLLSRRQLGNLKWLRQRPIDNFIVDFYCPELKLAIELDGASHDDKTDQDVERTVILEGYGVSVVRFSNNEVLNNLRGVSEKLLEIVNAFRQHLKVQE